MQQGIANVFFIDQDVVDHLICPALNPAGGGNLVLLQLRFDLEEMARRASKRKVMQKTGKTEQGKYSAKYALSELLVCGECGTPYKRCTWARNGKKRIVWRCVSRLEFGTVV